MSTMRAMVLHGPGPGFELEQRPIPRPGPGQVLIRVRAIPVLEAEFGKPVVMNLTASLWAALRHSGTGRTVQGWGTLLAGG